jgi:hypothetical protein
MTLHYGLRGSESNDGAFTEEEMHVVAGLGLGFLSGATGVSHIGSDEDRGYCAPWEITAEEAQARFELFKMLNPEGWDELKTQEPEAAKCFDRLLDIDFLQKLDEKKWSTNWGNSSTAEFIYKIGYEYGFGKIGMVKKGYFREYIPLNHDYRFHQEAIEKSMKTIAYMKYNFEPRINIDHQGSEEREWFDELLTDAWKALSERVGPLSIQHQKTHSTLDFKTEIPFWYGVYDVKVERNSLTIKRQADEEE